MADKKDINANIVKDIPEDKQIEIAAAVCEEYLWDIAARTEWENLRDEWYKLWACNTKDRVPAWENGSNVCLPILSEACNQFSGRMYQSFFASPNVVKVLPVGHLDKGRAKNVQEFMNWQVNYDMEEYEETFDKLFNMLPINGTRFTKLKWVKGLHRPVDEYISALDLVLPYSTKNLKTARRITHRLWLHYNELQDRDDLGLYENFDDIQETAQIKENIARDTQDQVIGQSIGGDAEAEPHLILENHKTIDIGDGKRKPYIITVDDDTNTLLRVTNSEMKVGATKETLNFFTDYHFIPNSEGFYSFGFGHFIKQLNEMANTSFNQIFDAGKITNIPFGFFGRRAGFKKKKFKIHPGFMGEVDDASQIHFPNIPKIDQTLFQVLGFVQQYVERFTSVSELLAGRQQKGVREPTKGGTEALIEQGLTTFSVIAKRIFRSYRKELRTHTTLNQLFLPETKQFRVMEKLGDIAFPEIKKASFSGKFDIIPTGDPTFLSKSAKRREILEFTEVMLKNPLIVGVPPAKEGEEGVPPNQKALRALLSDQLDAYERKDKKDFLPDIPEEPIAPGEENAMFMQGDDVEPNPRENFIAHLATHIGFLDTSFFRDMLKDYKPLVEQHILRTRQLQQIVLSTQNQLDGVPQTTPVPEGG